MLTYKVSPSIPGNPGNKISPYQLKKLIPNNNNQQP